MFYIDNQSNALRFGDIVRGFVTASPNIACPNSSQSAEGSSFSLDVLHSPYSVILSPCCSIGNKLVSLAPLIKILPNFLKNPYFEEDLTRINRLMDPDQTLAPAIWGQLVEEERQKRLAAGRAYALVDYFIFAPHDLLPQYKLHSRDETLTNYYMVDFRNISQVRCEVIITPANSPIDAKYLELSISTRKELREKIASYYGRTPQEDLEVVAV